MMFGGGALLMWLLPLLVIGLVGVVEIVEGEITVDTGTIVQRSNFEESQLTRP